MRRISFLLFIITLFLSVIGLFLIYESSSYTALYYLGDRLHYIKYQLIWFVLGVILALFMSKYDYKKLYNLSLPLLLITIFLLVAVFIPGIGEKLKGANRWINLRFTLFQPAEFLKISLTLYLAAWLSNKEKNRFFAFLLLLFICIFLVAIEPDLGTALVVGATSIVVYFLSGAKISEMFFVFFALLIASLIFIKVEPYRVARLTSFNSVSSGSVENTSYQVKQILIALGSGGVSGVGIGRSIEKYAYLPENTSDSIFAIYAEEMGFIGSVFLVAVLFFQIFLGFLISVNTTNTFGRLLSAGIITYIATQTFLNLASQVVLVPLTGVPLPFISYGGSSMVINLLSIGILLNIGNKIT